MKRKNSKKSRKALMRSYFLFKKKLRKKTSRINQFSKALAHHNIRMKKTKVKARPINCSKVQHFIQDYLQHLDWVLYFLQKCRPFILILSIKIRSLKWISESFQISIHHLKNHQSLKNSKILVMMKKHRIKNKKAFLKIHLSKL